MLRLLVWSLALVVLTAAPSCKSSESAAATSEEVESTPEQIPEEASLTDWPSDEDLVFKMKRYPCMGACEVYSFRIWEDGSVKYEGAQNVARLGRWRVQITQADIKAVIKRAAEIDFFSYEAEYPTGGIRIMDLPSTVSTLYLEGKTHQVINRNYPNPDVEGEIQLLERLVEFESFVDEIIASGTWTRIVEGQGDQ